MEQRLQLVTLGVADLDRSRRFYSEGLGWTPVLDLPEVVFYQVGHGLLLSLFPLAGLSADAGHPATSGTPFSLAQVVEDEREVERAVERLRSAGGKVLKEPQPAAFGGYHAYVADPDGHRWEVAHNPGLSIGPDGAVSIAPIP